MSVVTVQKAKLKSILDTVEYKSTTLGALDCVITNTPANILINPLVSVTRTGLRITPLTTLENLCEATYRIRVFHRYITSIELTEDSLENLVTAIIEKFANDGYLYGDNNLNGSGTPWETLIFENESDLIQFDDNHFYININVKLAYNQLRTINQI